MIEKMKAVLMNNDICVMATVAGEGPYCSLMTYVTSEDCGYVYMVTGKESTKYRNLMANSSVSLLVDTRGKGADQSPDELKALTVMGEFENIVDKDRIDNIRSRLSAERPHLKPLLEEPGSVVISIRVRSFLLLDGLRDSYFEKV